jgi:glutamate transport system permease protein
VIGVGEASYVMASMIEFRPDVLSLIFLIFAVGFVILTLPMGLVITSMSRRMAVKR